VSTKVWFRGFSASFALDRAHVHRLCLLRVQSMKCTVSGHWLSVAAERVRKVHTFALI
jgi:hypothetical protein